MSLRSPRPPGALALPFAVLFALAGFAAEAQAQRLEGREREAVDLCVDRAEELVRDRERGRGDVEVDEIVRAEEEDDEVEVQGYLRVADRDGDRREAWLDCTVDFQGENEITEFDEDGLLRSLRYDRERDRDRGYRGRSRRGDAREDARGACRELAEEQGYELVDVADRDRTDRGARLDLNLRRDNGRRFTATCVYNENRDEARFARLDPEDRRRGRR
jgi:hypothetical protein